MSQADPLARMRLACREFRAYCSAWTFRSLPKFAEVEHLRSACEATYPLRALWAVYGLGRFVLPGSLRVNVENYPQKVPSPSPLRSTRSRIPSVFLAYRFASADQ